MKLGCIGTGNMGLALIKGILNNGIVGKESLCIFDKNIKHRDEIADQYGVIAAKDNSEIVNICDMIILAVKPNVCASVLSECKDGLCGKAIVSVVTGWMRADIEAAVPGCRVLNVMPNTPCLVGAGMIAINTDHSLTEQEYAFTKHMFGAIGLVQEVHPSLMSAVTGVSGSGPAYVYMFIEALSDAGVKEGLPRDMAYKLAAQTVLGSAKTMLDTGLHPGALKDAVCSPGGTTIEAVAALERGGLRAAVIDAVEASARKARALSAK